MYRNFRLVAMTQRTAHSPRCIRRELGLDPDAVLHAEQLLAALADYLGSWPQTTGQHHVAAVDGADGHEPPRVDERRYLDIDSCLPVGLVQQRSVRDDQQRTIRDCRRCLDADAARTERREHDRES